MFFQLVDEAADREKYVGMLRKYADFIGLWVDALIELYEIADRVGAHDNQFHHASVLMLTRHIIECLDAVRVLVAQGCVAPCQPNLKAR